MREIESQPLLPFRTNPVNGCCIADMNRDNCLIWKLSQGMSSTRTRTIFVAHVGTACALAGYLLEAIRQRGTCDLGNNSPDTLGISLALIFIGAGVLGVSTLVSTIRLIRHTGWKHSRPALVASIISIICLGPIFLFAGAGPGSWFQYCGT